jgi:hypothetical protein
VPLGLGIEAISIISFGFIPTYVSEHDWININIKLYNNSKLIREKDYIITSKRFNWIFVTPGVIANYFKKDQIIELLLKDFFSNLP